MSTLVDKALDGARGALIATPFGFTLGYVCGSLYARFADLPLGAAEKGYAIWMAAAAAIGTFVLHFTEDMQYRQAIVSGVKIIMCAGGIYQLRKSQLMGTKLMIVMIALLILDIAYSWYKAIT